MPKFLIVKLSLHWQTIDRGHVPDLALTASQENEFLIYMCPLSNHCNGSIIIILQ